MHQQGLADLQIAGQKMGIDITRQHQALEHHHRHRPDGGRATQDRQHQLLSKLSERLTAASTYFHQLALNGSKQVRIASSPAKPAASRTTKAIARPTPVKQAAKKGKRA